MYNFFKVDKVTSASRLDRILIFLISAYVFFTIMYVAIKYFGYSDYQTKSEYVMSTFTLTGILIIYISIYCLIEMIFSTTLFKRIFGLKIVSMDSAKPKRWQILLRNVFRVTDDILLIGRIYMWFNKENRRLGDLVANTKIIERND